MLTGPSTTPPVLAVISTVGSGHLTNVWIFFSATLGVGWALLRKHSNLTRRLLSLVSAPIKWAETKATGCSTKRIVITRTIKPHRLILRIRRGPLNPCEEFSKIRLSECESLHAQFGASNAEAGKLTLKYSFKLANNYALKSSCSVIIKKTIELKNL